MNCEGSNTSNESTAKRCKKELPRTGGLMRTCWKRTIHSNANGVRQSTSAREDSQRVGSLAWTSDGLAAGTHGDVLNLHTESVLNVYTCFFHVFFTVPQHTKHTPRPPTTPPPQRHTPHNTTRRQKQRETEKERQEKRREEMKKKREEERENEQRQFFVNVRRRRNYFHAKFRRMSGSAGII